MAFQQRHQGIESRWRLIAQHLPSKPSWGLDVGSNLGDTSFRAAALGHTMIGIEPSKKLVARANAEAPEKVAFMAGKADPASLSSMPRFDFVFLLSVIHRIWAISGKKCAEDCLRAILDKTSTILFEGSIRHARYCDLGQPPPDFASNNTDSAVSWHMSWLRELAGTRGWNITHLGSVPCSAKEPFRPVFLLTAPVAHEKHTVGSSIDSGRQRNPVTEIFTRLHARSDFFTRSLRLFGSRYIVYRGRVFSGAKRGTRVIPKHTSLLRQLTGLDLVPGTLNIRLTENLSLDAPITFEAWRTGQTLTPAFLNDIPVFLYRWPRCAPDRVEIVSDVHLRTRLNLNEGDLISIRIHKRYVHDKGSPTQVQMKATSRQQ